MMWLLEILAALTGVQMLNLGSAVLCLALAAGMNGRVGAVLSALLCVAAVFL